MTKLNLCRAFVLFVASLNCASAFAKWGTVSIIDQSGDQVTVKHGLFGKTTIVKDRYGNGFRHSKSIFGLTKDTEVGVLNNDVHIHKGLFGFGKTEAHDVLGDSLSSKNNPLYRNTSIDLSGADAFLGKTFSPRTPSPGSSTLPKQPDPIGNMTFDSKAPLVAPGQFSGTKIPEQ